MDLYIEYFKYSAFILAAIACLFRNEIYFRLLIILACLLGMTYVFMHQQPSMLADILALSVLVGINLIMLLLHWTHKGPIKFSNKNEELLYQKGFSHFNREQFKKIVSVGEFVNADAGDVLTELGKPVLHLNMICEGKARVVVNGQTIAFSRPGDLVGEMSFITRAPATATVYILEPTVYIKWPQSALRELLDSDPKLQEAMQTVFNADFFRKHKTGSPVQTLPKKDTFTQDVPPQTLK